MKTSTAGSLCAQKKPLLESLQPRPFHLVSVRIAFPRWQDASGRTE